MRSRSRASAIHVAWSRTTSPRPSAPEQTGVTTTAKSPTSMRSGSGPTVTFAETSRRRTAAPRRVVSDSTPQSSSAPAAARQVSAPTATARSGYAQRWKSTAANQEGGAEIQSAMAPVTAADASTSATAALDGDGAPGRNTAHARRAVTANATGCSAAAGQGLQGGSVPRSARSGAPRLSIHPAAKEPRITGMASRTACTNRIAGPEVGRSTRNERTRYSTRSSAAGIAQRSAERAWCCASGSRQPGSRSVSVSGVCRSGQARNGD